MKLNGKKLFIITLLLFMIMSLSAVSAENADLNDASQSDDLVTDTVTNVSVAETQTDTVQDISNDGLISDEQTENVDLSDTVSLKDDAKDASYKDADKKNILSSNKLEEDEHTIYVSPYGPDDADGTMLKSYNTIKKALDSMNETGHYTIVLRTGNYTGLNNTALNISRDNVTIKVYDRAKVIVDNYPNYYVGWNITGSNVEIQGITFNKTYYYGRYIYIHDTENVTISGCTFVNGSYGYSPVINITDSKNIVVENSKFNRLTYGTGSYIVGALRSDVTIKGNEFTDSTTSPIILTNSNANISGNHFNNYTGYYGIYSSSSNSTIEDNIFENRNVSSYSTVYLVSSRSNISGNTFKNINITSTYGSGHAPIYVYSSSIANISDNDFVNTYAYYGGAIENPSPNTIVENNRFVNTSAYNGGAIYNTGTNLTLRNNSVSGANATQGIYVHNNGGTINTVNVTFLNNETVTTDAYSVSVPVLVTDDMGNPIYGKTVSVKLNETSQGTLTVTDGDVSLSVSNPGSGTYLVNGSYAGAINSNVNTGVIEFLDPYKGPFYVSTNGSDDNKGDEDHPFRTIEQAIRAAVVANNTHAVYINEGTYNVNNFTISGPVNITGIGNVTIDGEKKGRIFSVSGSNVNISNINFENANYSYSSTTYGGAVYWTGANGTLNNASFSNNVANCTSYSASYGGAVYWSGANGVINNTVFKNNTIRTNNYYSAYGGAVSWAGVNGTIENSTFEDNIANSSYSISYGDGGAVYWNGANGTLANNAFDSNYAYYGATIYNYGSNLKISNNTITNPVGTYGKYIYTQSNYGSINGAIVTILTNSTIETSMPSVDALITVTDDMGNPIYGGYVNVTLNNTNVITSRSISENATVTINSPGIGEYLVVPKYYHTYSNPNDNYTAKTAVINWVDEPYYGPFYVATDGSDSNRGDEDHPFATLGAAIKAANLTGAVPAIYIKEGRYNESDLNITKPVNITGIGDVIINAEGKSDILNISANYVNISNVGFANGKSSSDGGAIYWSGNYGKLENSYFVNNTAANRGGTIYNSGNYLKLSGNLITNSNATLGKNIYNYGSINGTTLILLNNDTVTLDEGVTAADISVLLVDDMGNSIAGGFVNVTMNKYNVTLMQNLTDDMVIKVFSPAYGEYLVNGSYRTLSYVYSTDLNNYTVSTGVLTFLSEPYYGPYYVSKNGSDYNDGSPEHPFATIGQAIQAASQDDVVPAIYVYEGTYDESNMNITKPMNITGLGDVIINANGSSNIFDVKANNTNISNIGFENAKTNGTGGAVTWSGANGTLNNATFINNSASSAGAIYWTGTNGTLAGSTFINNTASNRGGALVYVGNLDVTNNTFIDNSAVNEGGAIFTNKTGPVDMANSTFINNSARLGGAVFVDYNDQFTPNLYNNSHFNILDSSFINNTAQDGGAVVLYASNSTIRNSTFIGNNATRYGDGAVSSGGENNTIVNNTFINNTAFLYAGAIGSNSSQIINNTFINNSAYQAGAILTINDTIINNTFEGNNATIGKSIIYLQNYNLTNITCNCSLDDYECCDENCTCSDENFAGICNCTNHTVVERYSVLINNTLDDSEVYVYRGSPIMNVTLNYNGHYILSLDGAEELGAEGYCIEYNNSMPWEMNGTTGIVVNNLSFVRNSLDASYVGDYIKVALLLKESFQRWNIKELIFAFTDTDYMNNPDPDVQYIIDVVNDPNTILRNGDNWIDGEWYCGDFYSVIHPTTRQNLIIINGCGEIDLPHLTPEKEANVTTVQNGEYVNYTISVTNDEEIYLHNVTVRDIPDSLLTFIGWNNTLKSDGSPEDWIKDENGLVWYLNRTLLPGETVTFYAIFRASVPYNGPNNFTRDIHNTINVTSYETNWDVDEEVIQGLRPYLVIRKDTLDTNVSVGDPVRFLITVTNIGDAVANEVHVNEAGWSGNLYYLGWSNGFDNHTWTLRSSSNWYLNEPLNPHESASLIVIFNATRGSYMNANTALVYNDNGPTNQATNWTNISYVYLNASKNVVRIDGEIITYALTVTNVGCSTAYGVFITESNSYTFALVNWTDARGSVYNGRWSYSGPSIGSNFNTATWTLQDPLGPGGSATILLNLNTTYATSYSNGITVGDKDGTKNGTSTGGPLTRYLGAYKTVVDIKDDIISFMLTVRNNGNVTAHDAYIYENLYMSSSAFINWTDARGSYYNSDWTYDGNWKWTYIPPLGQGGYASIIVTFNTTNLTSYNNGVTVGEKNGFTNGTGTGGPLTRYLGAYKTVVDLKDDIITFALTVTNNGQITAHDVYIYDYGTFANNFINWTDARGYSKNSDWSYDSSNNRWTYLYPLGPGGSASIFVTYNTSNYSGYTNSISIGEKNGFTNGTGTSNGLYRYVGAYKTVLDQSDDTISFMLTVTNNGNITANGFSLQDNLFRGLLNGRSCNLTYINWTDARGTQFNSEWTYNGFTNSGNYTYYYWNYTKQLRPGASASIIVTFNTTNATAYSNGMSVSTIGGGNGTGISGNITRYIGAYKTVVDIKDDIITYALTITNNGNTSLDNVYIYENPYGPYMNLVNWTDARGSSYNSDWTYSGPSIGSSFTSGNWKLNYALVPGAARTILLTLNTTNAGSYSNSISVSATGTGNGTGLGGPLTRYLGAYKTVLEQQEDFITYMLTVTNQGNITAHEAYIQDSLSASMNLINWTDSRGPNMNSHWTYSGPSTGSSFGSARWTLQDPLGPGASASIILKLNTTYASGYSNSITVGEKNGYTNGTGVSNGIYRYLGAYKTVLDHNTTVGEPVRFMLTVTNNGNTTADMVYIQDNPYGPMSLLNWTDSRGSQFDSKWSRDGSNFKWTYADPLQPGGSLSLILTFNVTSNGTFSNGITVGDRFGSRNGTGESFNVSNVYLGAYKELLDETIVYGEPVRFLLAVTNNGNGTAHDVFIQESPSLSTLQFLNWTDSRGSQYNSDWSYDGNYKWTYKNPLGAGGTASIIVTFNVTAQPSNPSSRPGISNGMTVGDQFGTKNGTGNGWGIEYIPLGIYKSALNETPIRQGDNLSYLITVTNNGNGSAYNVWINETPDWDSLDFLNWTAMDSHSWTFNGTYEYNQTVIIDGEQVNVTKKYLLFTLDDELHAYESANLKLTFNVTAPSGGTFNSVTTGDNSSEGPKNGTGWNGYITSYPGISVEKITLNETVFTGNIAQFTIIVSNIGDCNLTEVFVKEDSYDGLVYIGFTDDTGKWSYDDETGIFSYDGILEENEKANFTVLFNTTQSGNFTNKVIAGSNETGNETAENVTEVFTPGLSVEKVTLNETVHKGELTEFNITVYNTGDATLSEVYVREQVPDGLVYVDFADETHMWYENDGVFIYNGTLAVGESVVFTVIFNTTKAGNFTNVVVANSKETDEEVQAENDTEVIYNPALEVIKITLNETVHKGELTEFNISVSNIGEEDLTEVSVREIIPDGLVYVGFVDDTAMWYENEGVYIYNGTLAVGESTVFTVIFNTTKVGNFTNAVVAKSNETDEVQSENVTEVIFNPNMTVEKIANNESVYVGQVVSYTITVTNTGEENLTHVFIDEVLPEGLEYLRYENTSGNWFICKEKWIFDGVLAPGESAELTIFFNTTAPGQINNTVIGGSDDTPNSTADNNTTVVYKPELSVEKITENTVVYNGQTVEFTIVVSNIGDCEIDSPFVVENVPEGLVFISYVDEDNKWTFDEETFTWTYNGALEAGESANFTVVFNTTASGEFTNVVTAGSNITENATANNTTSVFTPAVEVEKLANDEFVYNGNITSYVIKVVNTGDCDVNGVKVTENIPEGVIYIGYENKTGSWAFDESTYTWTLDSTLKVGETAEILVIFNTTQSGVINNTITVETNETGNTTVYNNTTIVYTPELTVEKIALNESVNKGQLAQFMIVVTNTGDCDLTKVFVEDSWPEGLIAVGFIDETDKWFNNGAHWIYDGTLKAGESANFTVVFYTNQSGEFTNVAIAGSNITGNETDNDTVKVFNPSVEVNKTANDDIVYVGNTTSYTITITNTGDTNLTDIIINEFAPGDLIYIDYINKTGKWIYDGTLQPGETAEFIVIYNTTASGRIDNKILLESGETPNSTASNNTTVVYSPSLNVEKITNNETVFVGNTSEFTIVVTNTGDCELTEVFVQEEIPDGLVYVDYVDSTGKWSYDNENKRFTYDGSLNVNESSEFVVVFNTTKSGEFVNTVTAGSNITGNETANNKTTVFSPSLEVEKIALNKTVYSGEETEFVIVVRNTGDCNLTNIVVEEVIPDGLTYYTFIDSTGKWANDGGVRWTYLESLAPGESANFTVIFDTSEIGNFTNAVRASSNETGTVNATNTTEVINKTVPDKNETEPTEKNETPAVPVPPKAEAHGLAAIKSGNPLLALLIVFAILGLSPLRRKRE